VTRIDEGSRRISVMSGAPQRVGYGVMSFAASSSKCSEQFRRRQYQSARRANTDAPLLRTAGRAL